jgi:hypothetical protein
MPTELKFISSSTDQQSKTPSDQPPFAWIVYIFLPQNGSQSHPMSQFLLYIAGKDENFQRSIVIMLELLRELMKLHL